VKENGGDDETRTRDLCRDSTPQALFSAPVAAVLGNLYDVTSDGKRFLFSGIYSSTGDVPLTLVMNWDAELKRR
jgi:hypothetical protein